MAKIAAIAPDETDEIIYLLNEQSDVNELKKLPKNKLRLALPTVCRRVDKFKPLIETLLVQGYKKWEIGNYWGLSELPKNGIDLSFDAPLYMLNTQAMQMAKEMNAGRVTLSVEDQWWFIRMRHCLPVPPVFAVMPAKIVRAVKNG